MHALRYPTPPSSPGLPELINDRQLTISTLALTLGCIWTNESESETARRA